MTSTKYKSSDPRMFTVPASDNLRDALAGNDVSTHTVVQMTAQRGVFEFTTRLYDELKIPPRAVIAKVVECYPNSRAESWEAFWFAHTNKVARMAEDYRNDQNRASARKQV